MSFDKPIFNGLMHTGSQNPRRCIAWGKSCMYARKVLQGGMIRKDSQLQFGMTPCVWRSGSSKNADV